MIGTAAAIALAIMGGASAATNVYNTRSTNRTNRDAMNHQQRSEDLDREQRQREVDQSAEADRQRWADYVRIMSPYWDTSTNAFSSLRGMAGLPGGGGGGMPPMPPGGAPPSTSRAPATPPRTNPTQTYATSRSADPFAIPNLDELMRMAFTRRGGPPQSNMNTLGLQLPFNA